ncbi:VWA domain-containing protein [Leptospira koniambonensis]|uniref:VWA domain-containing protein n=1 Tax=Leptospira koniambonensis TaxID=2484950 RepID=A0A4V3JND8_9LEPT|nr:VWA domain-containing protein [Leptospira koniambonensis]TGL34559.1 VWA domain-containing protein [Leptospira koniambonensis]
MGYGNYSHAAHEALIAGRAHRSAKEVFTQTGVHVLMDPKGLKVRESRDSADHPNSMSVIFALDVTGSMGAIPDLLARKELPTFMKLLNSCGIADPQLLFMAIGDANSDRAPLQVGQFESTAELMDQWLTRSFLEGGGGGSGEESYELAFYLAAQHTDLDCWNKRKKKGYLFLTGDELPYPTVSRHQIGSLVGDHLDEDLPIEEVIAAAAETYHLFFLIPDLQRRYNCEKRWRELLGDQVICMESPEDTCTVAAAIVGLTEKAIPDVDSVVKILQKDGLSKSRVGAVARAIQPYADLLDKGIVDRLNVQTSKSDSNKRSWWRKIFD